MNNDNKQIKTEEKENDDSIIISKEKKESLSYTTTNERITIKNSINNNEKDNFTKNEVKIILNKIINYNQNNTDKNLIFECPNKCCPFIPYLKYYEFTQSVATKCRLGHEYHLSLINYFEIVFNKSNNKYCHLCLKKNYSNNKSTSEFFCINCCFYLCKRCQVIHNKEHQILDLYKINTYCPNHDNKKFSGYCNKCQIDLCIHCLKDHKGGHHSLLKYFELIPSKDKITKYRNQINNELKYIDYVKNILLENKVIQNKNEINMALDFFDKMKLKYYFYEYQLHIFDKI